MEPISREHRLGLSRALLWGDRPKEAEQLLRGLHGDAPGDTMVVALLHEARARDDAGVPEARGWVEEEPAYQPYRLAYARALLNAGLAQEAAEQLDVLVAANPTPVLLREAAA